MIPRTLSELYDNYKDELERRGWFVLYSADLNCVTLFSENKDGARADIFIGYGVDEEVSPKKLWYVKCKGEGRASFKRIDEAIRRFLEHCKDANPKDFTAEKGTQEEPSASNFPGEPVDFNEPLKSFSITFVIFGVMLVAFIAGVVSGNFDLSFYATIYIFLYILIRIIKGKKE